MIRATLIRVLLAVIMVAAVVADAAHAQCLTNVCGPPRGRGHNPGPGGPNDPGSDSHRNVIGYIVGGAVVAGLVSQAGAVRAQGGVFVGGDGCD